MSTPNDTNDGYSTSDNVFDDTASDTEVEDAQFTDPQFSDRQVTDRQVTDTQFADTQFSDTALTPPPLSRPTGPSWSTVALGLIALVVAGGALFIELTDVELDWERFGPLAVVGMGLLLVLVGLAALLRRSDDEDPPRH